MLTEGSKPKKDYAIQTVENAFSVLEAMSRVDEGTVRITRLSEEIGLEKSYVFRVLATFEKLGYVEKVEAKGTYQLALSAYEVGRKLLYRNTLLNKAKPIMERLARQTDEAVYLAMARGEEILLLDMVDTTQVVCTAPLVGRWFPLAECAPGKIALTFDEALCKTLPGGVSQKLTMELAVIRDRGSVVCVEGFGEGVACLAVPLFKGRAQFRGSLCLVGPSFRFNPECLANQLLPALCEAAQIVSSRL